MTVSTEVNQAAYTGNGVTTVFPYTFRILNDSNLTVTRIDLLEVETVLTLGTDYTVSGAGAYNGGSVTLPQPLPNGYSLVIERDLAIVQETDLRNQGTFFAEVHEDAFDYLTMIIQQVASWFGLALRRPTIKSKFYDAKQYRIANLADPINDQDAVNTRSMRSYVEKMIAGVIGGFGWFIQSGSGAVNRTFQDKMRDTLNPKDFGAKGDGVTNDSTPFSYLESYRSGDDIDLSGLTYLVNSVPSGNRYFNGKFLVSGITYDANYILGRSINKVVTLLGDSGTLIPANYALPEKNRFTYRNMSFFAGGAGGKLTASGQSTGIGADAMGNTVISFDNNAIGECALQNVQSTYDYYTTTNPEGTRNVALGGNTLQFTTTGWNNVAVGRNAGTCAVNTVGMIAIGNGAFGGIGENGWYDYIENFCPNTSGQVYSVAAGQAAGAVYQGVQLTTVGGDSGKSMRKGIGNSLFGRQAGSLLESLLGLNGKQLTTLNASATYVKTGTNMVITIAGHNTVVGGYIAILPTSGPADVTHNHVFPCLVTAVSGNDVTVQCPYAGDGTGSVTVGWTVNTTDGTLSQTNSAFGDHSIMRATVANDVAANGNRSGQNATALTRTVLSGSRAGQNATTITDTVLEGTDAGNNATAFNQCTGLGGAALRVLIDGSIPTTLTNSTAVGYNARVSGDNQFQIGNATQSPYAYSAVQLRSDGRDKRNIRDTELGIEFILGLRPVQYNANPRDAYYEEYNVQVGIDDEANPVFETRYKFNEEAYLAGEKSGGRDHQGLIFQEVDALAQSLQTDFAGLHNHSRRGGCDVGSIGYQQLDGPMIKTMHQLFDVIEMLIDEPEKAKERIKAIREAVPIIAPFKE